MTFARYVMPDRRMTHDDAYAALNYGPQCIREAARRRDLTCEGCKAESADNDEHTYRVGCAHVPF